MLAYKRPRESQQIDVQVRRIINVMRRLQCIDGARAAQVAQRRDTQRLAHRQALIESL